MTTPPSRTVSSDTSSSRPAPAPALAVRAFFDPVSHTVSYILADPASGAAAVIDPVLDYPPNEGGPVATTSADAILACARAAGWRIVWSLETHIHADHVTAAAYIRDQTGARVAIGAGLADLLGADGEDADGQGADGEGAFDLLLHDGQRLPLGGLEIEVMTTPGHTPVDVSYRVGDAVFVGDTLFMPDAGTARADFPGGGAATLYRSIQRLLALPPDTRLYLCHDYKAPGRDHFAWETTVAAQRAANIHVRDGVDEASYVTLRTTRDTTLPPPRLMGLAVAANLRAGVGVV